MKWSKQLNRERLSKVQLLIMNLETDVTKPTIDQTINEMMAKHINFLRKDLLAGFKHNSWISFSTLFFENTDMDDDLYKSLFPQIDVNHPDHEEVILNTYNYQRAKNQIKDLKTIYLNPMKELELHLNYLVNHDTNKFLRLFKSSGTKARIAQSRQYVMDHYNKVEEVQAKVAQLKASDTDKATILNEYKKSKVHTHRFYSKLLGVDPLAEDYIFKTIQNQVELFIRDVKWYEADSLEEEIKSQITELSKSSIDNLPVDFFLLGTNDQYAKDMFKQESIETIGQLKDFLGDSNNYMRDSFIERLKLDLADFIKDYQESYYPKLTSQKPSVDDLALMELLYFYRVTTEDNGQNEDFLNQSQTVLAMLERLFTYRKNEFHESLLNVDDQRQVDRLAFKIVDATIALTKFFDLILSKYRPSQNQITKDFQNNSAAYYAIIDKAYGSSSGHQTNNLPSSVVKKVEDFRVDLAGFHATLRPYQDFGVKYALTFKKVLLGDEMGLGKTLQAIAVANHLYNHKKKYAVVVAPLSVLANWRHEIDRWSTLEIHTFRGKDREDAFNQWRKSGGFLLLNYEQSHHLTSMLGRRKVNFVVVDEAHYIKNPSAKRTQNTNKIAKMAEYNLFMTGTPLENRLDEMKQLISVLNPDLYQKIQTNQLEYDTNEFKTALSLNYLRRKRDEVLKELPDLEVIQHWSSFSSVEQSYYNEAVSLGISGLMKMRRAGFYGKSPKHSEKIQQIIDICTEAEDNGDKVLIFSFFKIVLNELTNHLNNRNVRIITGEVSSDNRQGLIKDFTDDKPGSVMLCQIEAGGVGLNIQAANVVILCEPQWKPSTENQAISRVYRMGQTKNVIVYRLLTEESIDETMLEILSNKTDIFNAYARDSAVSEAYDLKAEVSEADAKKKVFEIEQDRLKQKTTV